MSLSAIRWAWTVDATPTEKLLLLALADCCQGSIAEQTCWPSLARLAAMTGLAERSVRRSLRAIEARGLIAADTGGGRNTSTYRICAGPGDSGTPPAPLSEVSAPPDTTGQAPPDTASPLGGHCGPLPRTLCPPRGDTVAPHPGQSGPRTSNRTGREPGRQREERKAAREGTAQTLSQTPIPDWEEIARSERPDIDPKACWAKFCVYYQDHQTTADGWNKLWRIWCQREWKNRSKLSIFSGSYRRPGDFLGSGKPDDLAVEYEVVHGP